MLYLDGLFGLVALGLWIFCLLDVISTDESSCRNLGKTVWVLLVLFFPVIGSIAWLVAGRPQAPASMPYKGNHGPAFPDSGRPRRYSTSSPEDDEDFLLGVRARAEEQRLLYQEQKRRELGEGGSTRD